MKIKLLPCLALILSGIVAGCAGVAHREPYEPLINAINNEDRAALRRLAKPGMQANRFISGWEKHPPEYSPRVAKEAHVNKNAIYPEDGRPCILYEFKFENNKDGSLNPHLLQVFFREEDGKSTLLDFWSFGW